MGESNLSCQTTVPKTLMQVNMLPNNECYSTYLIRHRSTTKASDESHLMQNTFNIYIKISLIAGFFFFTPSNIHIRSNVPTRQWVIWKSISEEKKRRQLRHISKPSVDSLIRTLHRELTAKLFTSVFRLCCFCLQQTHTKKNKWKCVWVCERRQEGGREKQPEIHSV